MTPPDSPEMRLWKMQMAELKADYHWHRLGKDITQMVFNALGEAGQTGEQFVLTADELAQLLREKQ